MSKRKKRGTIFWMPWDPAEGFWVAYGCRFKSLVMNELEAYKVPIKKYGLKVIRVEIRAAKPSKSKSRRSTNG